MKYQKIKILQQINNAFMYILYYKINHFPTGIERVELA